MKLTQELINVLQAIHDGKPWEWGSAGKWRDAEPCFEPCPIQYISQGFDIRLKPAPAPAPDPYAEAKQAWNDGELQWCRMDSDWEDWRHFCAPSWNLPPHCYRRKPKTVRVPLGPEDVPPGSVFRLPQWDAASYRAPNEVNEYGVRWLGEGTADAKTYCTSKWEELQKAGWLINRPDKRFASGMPETWEQCWKEVQP